MRNVGDIRKEVGKWDREGKVVNIMYFIKLVIINGYWYLILEGDVENSIEDIR